jgi:hypothetical protein
MQEKEKPPNGFSAELDLEGKPRNKVITKLNLAHLCH